MKQVRFIFWLCIVLVPISFIGLQIFFYITQPSKDSFYVGASLAQAGVVYLIDLCLFLFATLCIAILMFIDKANRKKWLITWIVSLISVVLTFVIISWVAPRVLPIYSLL